MIHHDLRLSQSPKPANGTLTSAHWGIGRNETCILLQVDDGSIYGEARIKLTPEEALNIAAELINLARCFYEEQALESGK